MLHNVSEVRFLSTSEAQDLPLAWPDVYFTPGYGEASAYMEGGSWEVAVYGDGQMLYPYIKRPIPGELGLSERWDIISPYGYAGIWGRPDCDDSDWSAFRTALRTALPERGVVAEFLRLGEIVPGRGQLLKADPHLTAQRLSETIAVDLSRGYHAYFDGSEGRSRTAIRKALRTGYQAKIRPAELRDLTEGGDFRTLYDATMRRLGAKGSYLMEDMYYRTLHSSQGERLQLCEVTSVGGQVEAAALFMRHDPWLHYHLAGSRLEAARNGANNLLIDTAVRFGVEQGIASLHLGGGVSANDGLFRFKAGFGGRRLAYWIARNVLSSDDYETLVTARAKNLDVDPKTLKETGFFPAYRAGV
jgi:hypothetical protein